MDNCRMNYRNMSGGRNCQSDCSRQQPAMPVKKMIQWDNLPIAMGYVPVQQLCEVYDITKALQMGTIFPELCKPFCGKGGGCR
jgi:hypothetical protein